MVVSPFEFTILVYYEIYSSVFNSTDGVVHGIDQSSSQVGDIVNW